MAETLVGHRRLHPKCNRVSGHGGLCASVRDRRRGNPPDSGRQAASPSPKRELDTVDAGRARCEWCSGRESSAPARPDVASPVILGRRLRAPSAVGRVRSAARTFVLFDDAPDRPCVPVPLSLCCAGQWYSRAATLP
jgi:hypothetical protein